ncbi:MAG: flagellar protein FliT [Lachnospiraceae bacterium]|nr:flagellar protein FliT [Lachnospiraceae bacterium]
MPENYLMIMIQSLKKKIEVLDCIIDADERQKIDLEDPSLDPDDFDKIVEEKARYIEHLDLLDQGFDKLFERVKEQVNNNRELYKNEIKEMQALITTVTEKSNEIQVQEARNKELMTQKFTKVHKQARDVRASQQAVNQYYQNMKKINYIDPQFMDNKK